jgi:hypothetical protein
VWVPEYEVSEDAAMSDRPPPLPITAMTFADLEAPPPAQVLIIGVDATGRPDVADLCRVMTQEGQSSVSANWSADSRRVPTWVSLSVQCLAPVECRFSIEMELPENIDLARMAAAAERIAITPEPLAEGGSLSPTALIDLDANNSWTVLKNAIARIERAAQ